MSAFKHLQTSFCCTNMNWKFFQNVAQNAKKSVIIGSERV